MINLQEHQEWIDNALERIRGYLMITCEDDREKEICNTFIDNLEFVCSAVYQSAVANLQTLSLIISDNFDGEYAMSRGDIIADFSNKNYFLDIQTHDDGSVVISAHNEEK